MALDIQNNPFKQNDLKLQALRLQEDSGSGSGTPPATSSKPPRPGQERESAFQREEMVLRSITVANPPEQELVLVLDSTELRDTLFTVLKRFAAQFPAPAKLE
jgi:hypothetical protein